MAETVGMRVGAILSSTAHAVNFLGYGVYDGDLACPLLGGFPNPRITLDNGEVVWGCQCWWGDEARIRKQIEEAKAQGHTINEVKLSELT